MPTGSATVTDLVVLVVVEDSEAGPDSVVWAMEVCRTEVTGPAVVSVTEPFRPYWVASTAYWVQDCWVRRDYWAPDCLDCLALELRA